MPTHSQRLEALCDEMAQAWRNISPRIDEVKRLSNMERPARDGYPRSTMNGDARGSDVANPTANAALDDHVTPDIVATWVEEAMAMLPEMVQQTRALARNMRTLDDLTRLIEKRGDKRHGRQVTGDYCAACARWVPNSAEDRLKRGYCRACYEAWKRYCTKAVDARQDPSPEQFKRERLKENVA